MKRTALILSMLFISGVIKAAEIDTSKVIIPDITYPALDSLIRTSEYTGIFFWAGWCGGCAKEFPALIDAAHGKKNIAFYSINDPDSNPLAPKGRFNHPDVLNGFYRIQRYGKKPAISINDFTQQRYFLWYYTRRTNRAELKQTLSFVLLNKKGELLYASRSNVNADSVKNALAAFK